MKNPKYVELIINKEDKLTKENMKTALKSKKSRPMSFYKKGAIIKVDNRMQKKYSYVLFFNAGTNLDKLIKDGNVEKIENFKPYYTPKQMLNFGIFEGKYINDQIFEYPNNWYDLNKLSPEKADEKCNYFKIKSRLNLQHWRKKKWIPCVNEDNIDPRGWFEWYCRFWLGRRSYYEDLCQINRWKRFSRHYGAYLKHTKGDKKKHPRRRQGLLQWSYECMS